MVAKLNLSYLLMKATSKFWFCILKNINGHRFFFVY